MFKSVYIILIFIICKRRLPCCLSGKNPPANAGDVNSILGPEDPLEKEMATHSSILAWRIHGQKPSGWGRADESCVIGFTFQMGQTILLPVSTLSKVKWTPSDGNFLMLTKGGVWEEGLHWKAEIHVFPQIPVTYIIHRDGLSKSDVLHTFWEQVRGNKHCWMTLCIGVREQESVQPQ